MYAMGYKIQSTPLECSQLPLFNYVYCMVWYGRPQNQDNQWEFSAVLAFPERISENSNRHTVFAKMMSEPHSQCAELILGRHVRSTTRPPCVDAKTKWASHGGHTVSSATTLWPCGTPWLIRWNRGALHGDRAV